MRDQSIPIPPRIELLLELNRSALAAADPMDIDVLASTGPTFTNVNDFNAVMGARP